MHIHRASLATTLMGLYARTYFLLKPLKQFETSGRSKLSKVVELSLGCFCTTAHNSSNK